MAVIYKNFGYGDDLFGFARFPDAVRENSRFPVLEGLSEYVPERDRAYVFRKEHLKTIQYWTHGAEKNILLQGETGTGKTTLIEQVAARLNWPVFAVGCHGGMEFQEFIGRVTLLPDGSTGWADGPLIAAMRLGGILLLDEMNFLPPEVAGGLNTALQAKVYTIPETGELVKAHQNFRIGATGNAIDGVGKGSYKGTQKQNIALLSRFTLGIRVKYMSVNDEVAMMTGKAPGIHPKVANYLAEIADMARKAASEGALTSPLSPRETISSAQRLTSYSGNLTEEPALQAQCKGMLPCLEMTFLFRWGPDDRTEFIRAANSVANRLGLPITLE
ncbi:ATP-binding protein [Rhodoferax antarcticus]|uniref:ATPase n=1 Tax=Rhodoferax antarcticus ANT.BR TaxID=1111071 RepID=A0A1Q8Y962_9BURK|nr:AAA family ATPase [Rhodoferax antarcticus]OLP04592.1 ATPase [Rhodoferax antarcticus ANT.BR]